MTWRILEAGNAMPWSFPVHESATFQAGTAMTLTTSGGQIVATPSNGMGFIGIVDDVKTTTFTAVSWDEQVIVTPDPSNIGLNGSNQLVILSEIRTELENPNIVKSSFVSNPVEVEIVPRNGVIVFPAGTVLNLDLGGMGTPDSIKTIVRYNYQIPNVIGDDTTMATKLCTIWFQRMLFETDQFETNQSYGVMSNLFINENGLFTTRQILPNSPVVAICTAPPSSITQSIQALLL